MTQTENPTQLKILSDLEIEMSRLFDAPRALVFKAYTDPQAIPQWWGLRTNTTRVDQMDPRPGGLWRYVQRDAEGNEDGFRGEYREVVAPERLTYTFEWEGMPGHIIVDRVTFEARGGQTLVTVTSRFATVEDRDGMLASGMEAGANETWERLAEYLQEAKGS